MSKLYGATWKGTYSSYKSYFRVWVNYTFTANYSATQSKLVINSVGIQRTSGNSAVEFVSSSDCYVNVSITSNGTTKWDKGSASIKWAESSTAEKQIGSGTKTCYFTKGETAKTITITAKGVKGNSAWSGSSTGTVTLTVPALEKHTLSFDGNSAYCGGQNPTGIPSPKSLIHGVETDIIMLEPPVVDGYSFTSWNTSADGTGVKYFLSPSIAITQDTTLYAQWGLIDPPRADYGTLNGIDEYGGVVAHMTELSVDYDVTYKHDGRNISSVYLTCGSESGGSVSTETGTVSVSPTMVGNKSVTLVVEDDAGAVSEHLITNVLVVSPTWTRTVQYELYDGVNGYKSPDLTTMGTGIMQVEAYNYSNDAWDTLTGDYEITVDDTYWSFNVTLNEHQVSTYSDTPSSKIRVTYDHSESYEKEYRTAFFATTRNANYSNGIYNTMFVSGCTMANYSSRVWWCYPNNPLYFPDSYYVEVGSNDTAVMGLIKVSDYLGAIKQSKTTDTAIYLLYPTSFEEDTTYAVKQGVQGIGALGKYTFNILGDETLFLSPNGVMAIEPMADGDHKVRNRSYFVDKKLLAEENIAEAYSFVYDGMYYLAVGGGCYVLDGNQRNSWGNDKTNLVYECYYLDNVKAECFVKYNNELWFSNGQELCRFRAKGQPDSYVDAYDVDSDDTNVPVKAEWSTILDDDGALNYYKTMQKKGNLVSILPLSSEVRYVEAEVDESTFNANKTNYYYRDADDVMTQCTKDSIYNPEITYFVIKPNGTKVYIKKDDGKEVEISRSFGRTSEIPSELFINKKFKKYKRLQFIIRNEDAEDFGVDSIIKCFTLQNYAKK